MPIASLACRWLGSYLNLEIAVAECASLHRSLGRKRLEAGRLQWRGDRELTSRTAEGSAAVLCFSSSWEVELAVRKTLGLRRSAH